MRAAEEDDWDPADRCRSAGVSTGYPMNWVMKWHAPRTRRYSNGFPGQMQRSQDLGLDGY